MKRGKIFKKNCIIYVSKGVIWASEYSLGPQIWGPGGPGAPPWIRYCTHLNHVIQNLKIPRLYVLPSLYDSRYRNKHNSIVCPFLIEIKFSSTFLHFTNWLAVESNKKLGKQGGHFGWSLGTHLGWSLRVLIWGGHLRYSFGNGVCRTPDMMF